jgi:hypothetical protein
MVSETLFVNELQTGDQVVLMEVCPGLVIKIVLLRYLDLWLLVFDGRIKMREHFDVELRFQVQVYFHFIIIMEEVKKPPKWLLITHLGAGSAPKDPEKTVRVQEMLRKGLKTFSKHQEDRNAAFVQLMTQIEVRHVELIEEVGFWAG